MRIVEFRIFMPLKIDQCRIASKYSVNKTTTNVTGDGDGFEVIEAKNVIENGKPCRYVHRILHCKKKIPSIVRWAIPDKYCHVHEHNHNCFPRYVANFDIPAMGKKFLLHTETNHIEYHKGQEIPYNLTNMCDKDLKKREVYYLDILNGPEPKKAELDLHGYSCPEIGLAELKAPKHISNDKKIPEWVSYYEGPLTLIVKTVKFKFKMHGVQALAEKVVCNAWYHIYLDTHRSMLKWGKEWYNLTEEDVQKIENQTKDDLNNHEFDRD